MVNLVLYHWCLFFGSVSLPLCYGHCLQYFSLLSSSLLCYWLFHWHFICTFYWAPLTHSSASQVSFIQVFRCSNYTVTVLIERYSQDTHFIHLSLGQYGILKVNRNFLSCCGVDLLRNLSCRFGQWQIQNDRDFLGFKIL